MAPLLSEYRTTRSTMLETTHSSMMNFLTQIASFIALDVEMYLASVVESVVVTCLELFQLTTPPFRVKIYHD